MARKTLIIGANGALGTDLLKQIPHAIGATHADFDICDLDAARKFIEQAEVHAIVNTAAFHQVPNCESQYAKAFEVNAIGVRNLAQISAERDIHLCHISTDYVFDGSKGEPYLESDLPAPLSIYAITKLAGEHALAAYGSNWSVVRSCGLYGEIPTRAKGGNFVSTMIRLGQERDVVQVVDDEIVCPTYTKDLAHGIGQLLDANGRGLFHITQAESCSWYDFAKVIFEQAKLPARLESTKAANFQSVVKRPTYSILNCDHFQQITGHQMPHWKDALERHLTALGHPKGS